MKHFSHDKRRVTRTITIVSVMSRSTAMCMSRCFMSFLLLVHITRCIVTRGSDQKVVVLGISATTRENGQRISQTLSPGFTCLILSDQSHDDDTIVAPRCSSFPALLLSCARVSSRWSTCRHRRPLRSCKLGYPRLSTFPHCQRCGALLVRQTIHEVSLMCILRVALDTTDCSGVLAASRSNRDQGEFDVHLVRRPRQ